MRNRRVFIIAREIPYYFLVALALYLAVMYAPLLYKSITFKGYIKNVISSPDHYSTYAMRELILAEASRQGFLIDDIYIEPKNDEMTTHVEWHVVVNHLGIFKHRMDFKSDVSVKIANI